MNENYRALTRQYRPQTFEDIVSQEHVSSTLKNAIRNNRLSHAYMFCGPRGVGKTTMARVLARAVNQVADVVDGESLSQTLNIVEMDAASNRKIEDVRSLKEIIRVPPQNGRFKIFIIDEVHMLTKEAFNALLKTLEEPPPHAIFIFATTEPHKVLPTILSRVQRFDFKRISVSEIVKRLRDIAERESIQIDDESLHVIAKRADGALRDALGLMDQAIAFCGDNIEYKELLRALNVVDRDDLFTLVEILKKKDSHAGLTLIRDLIQGGTDIQEFLVTFTEHIRNLYVALGSERLHLVEATEETRQRYVEQAEAYSEKDLMRMLHLVSEAQYKLKEAQQPRVHFEILVLKLIHMSRSAELDTLIRELNELKKNSDNHSEGGHPATPGTHSGTTAGKKEIRKDESPPDGITGKDITAGPERSQGAGSSGTEETGSERIQEQAGRQSGQSSEKAVSIIPEHKRSGHITTEHQTESGPGKKIRASMSAPVSSEEDNLYGKPSLGEDLQHHPAEKEKRETIHHIPEKKHVEKSPGKGINGIGDVKKRWEFFLQTLKEAAPQMLYYQMQRVQPADLKGRDLVVTVDNEFARQMVEENQVTLTGFLKKEFGKNLKIRCIVDREKTKKTRTLSPYDQFRELQKKDPHIRTLVDLFGAELEY